MLHHAIWTTQLNVVYFWGSHAPWCTGNRTW